MDTKTKIAIERDARAKGLGSTFHYIIWKRLHVLLTFKHKVLDVILIQISKQRLSNILGVGPIDITHGKNVKELTSYR